MVYLGSKNRIAKQLIPIIQSYITSDTESYIEFFVGGANVIDKIKCGKKIGYDIHPQLIALLNKVKIDISDIPDDITEDMYISVKNNKNDYEDWYIGLVGFCATFASKYFGGYARDKNKTRDISSERIRNIKKQSPNLQGIEFKCNNFLDVDISNIRNSVIYLDPPYRNTTKYSIGDFPYDKFYDWVKELSKYNIVLISEYNMPNEFVCIWEKEHFVTLGNNRSVNNNSSVRIEKLFIYNPSKKD